MALYKHKPLSPGRCTRVLLLHPNKDRTAPIQISLLETALPEDKEERAMYEALSYVWGAKTGDQKIDCDGSPLLVTANCLAALQRLRLDDTPRSLWIDAICIDQGAGTEKNHQLKLMGDIYSRAQRTLVWLGQDNGLVAQLFRQLSRPEEGGVTAASLQTVLSNPWFSRAWTLQELCYGRDVLMIYGETAVSWAAFVDRLDWRKHQDKQVPAALYTPFVKTTSFYGLFQIMSDPSKMTERFAQDGIGLMGPLVFSFVRDRKATEAQDKIYAFHRLLVDIGFRLPNPDVAKPVPELYEEVTFILVQQSRSLKLLESVASKTRMDNLPSWVPDYSQESWPPGSVDQGRGAGGGGFPTFPGNWTLAPRTPGRLKLKGLPFSTVRAVGARMPDVDEALSDPRAAHSLAIRILETIYRWMSLVQNLDIPLAFDAAADDYSHAHPDSYPLLATEMAISYPDPRCSVRIVMLARLVLPLPEPDVDAGAPDMSAYLEYLQLLHAAHQLWHWLQLMFDQDRRAQVMRAYPDQSVARRWAAASPAEVYRDLVDHDRRARPMAERMIASLSNSFFARHREEMLLITHNGALGVSAGNVEPGDMVVLFPGASLPFVVRPVADDVGPRGGGGDDGEDKARLVGTTYIPDCMDLEWNDPSTWEDPLMDLTLV
ncbi:hypothetical protein PV08_06669 [Exophiala spinifera]|uniref:Heterokaryon incompatibility domain-containing protein n=1 Tax=Exophiala spinifera TaxID=91928 RepID=A0A0D2B4N2_9EURO|nr:uncharacterized protein PV08_06669 [Exophiala spinifera]KIW13888.1 hypothetical protein PV08_06669 [Exophiala spinifera]